MSGSDAQRNAWRPQVGQHIYIAGTGKWWTGEHFGATIVDVRHADSTVKVRYTNGGFKRFPADEFRTLVSFKDGAPEMWSDWSSAPQKEPHSDLSVLHARIMEASRRQDKEQAEELSKQFEALAAIRDAQSELQFRLRDAIECGDFLRAHEVQEKLKALAASASTGCLTLCHTSPPSSSSSSSSSMPPPRSPSIQDEDRNRQLMMQVGMRSFESGIAGATAMTLQVVTLMWLRTTMNYQYRYGLGMTEAMRILHSEGGLPRFYRGIGPALLQGPLSRFGDTAANAGVMAFFDETEARSWPAPVKTVFASGIAAFMRIALVPLDTVKTVLQVESRRGLKILGAKYMAGGLPVFFHGAVAASAATFVGHYPWFTTFNTLNERLPDYPERHKQLMRNAGIGFCSSVISDTVVNSLRVLKTVRQTHETKSYSELARDIVRQDGVAGLLGRGLKTRLIANGCSGVVFAVLYKSFDQKLFQKTVLA